jgi:hypothetical protein
VRAGTAAAPEPDGQVGGCADGLQAYAQSNTTSLVIFSVKTAAGNPQARLLSLEAVVDPDDDGSNIFWGWGAGANTVNLTNGMAAVRLEPNDYTVTLAGAPGSFTISVATNGMTYNAVDITTNLPGYLSASAGPATVIFPLLTMTGSAQTRSLGLAPIINPVKNGTNIIWGPALTATPTNGLATTHLEPNGYTVTMNGSKGALTIYVPTDGGTYNAASLPSTMPGTAPEFGWEPPTVRMIWTDANTTNSNLVGNLATFNATANKATVNQLIEEHPYEINSMTNLSALPALYGISISDENLSWLVTAGATNLIYLDISENLLSTNGVDAVLIGLTSNGQSNGTVWWASSRTNVTPSSAGAAARATLISRGWTLD